MLETPISLMAPDMSASATLLSGGNASAQDRCVARVLEFFGIASSACNPLDVFSWNGSVRAESGKTRVLCSANAFLELIEDVESNRDRKDDWSSSIHSAFIYPGDDLDALRRLVRLLTEGELTASGSASFEAQDFVVSDEFDDFCGVMAGIRVNIPVAKSNVCSVSDISGDAIPIISSRNGAFFLKSAYHGFPIFISTSNEIVDVDAELDSENFSVRNHFLSAVPIVLYTKWAFRNTCWDLGEANACLIIDDPLLQRRYGCVDFERLLAAMEAHRFSTSIAFIPWNWRRSSPDIVRLFKENAEKFSLSVHGCDHVRGEFGTDNRPRLYAKAKRALERMTNHARRTGVAHDCVMIFPQGVFSNAGMAALKQTDFIAAVNNDVVNADEEPAPVTVADVWAAAVMRYSDFPIFTRRYPWEGVENFAFDVLLGKPALIVIHHEYCCDGCERLNKFVEALNGLKCSLRWRNLGDVIRHSYWQRTVSSGRTEVEMYAKELVLENHSAERMQFHVRRRDSNPADVKEIRSGANKLAHKCRDGFVTFSIELNSGESTLIRIIMHELNEFAPVEENVAYRLKAGLRRYLCELRDNHITPTRLRLVGSR